MVVVVVWSRRICDVAGPQIRSTRSSSWRWLTRAAQVAASARRQDIHVDWCCTGSPVRGVGTFRLELFLDVTDILDKFEATSTDGNGPSQANLMKMTPWTILPKI